MASFQGLQPRIFLGLNTRIKGNINYVSDSDVLYPAGGVLVLHNYVQQTQSYIKLPEPQKVLNIIIVSPNKKIIAIAEEGDKPCISLYDVKSMKRTKVLGLPYHSSAKEFASIAFTFDSNYLVAIVGEPDWTMLYYDWEKGKVESLTRANNPPAKTGPVTQVAPNPTDAAVVVIVGPGLFRLLRRSDTVWRQYGYNEGHKLPIKCVCWLTTDRVLAGTEDNRLIVFENGDLRAEYTASEIFEFDLLLTADQPGAVSTITSNNLQLEANNEVTCILAFSNGFAFSIANYIFVFETETKYRYKRKNVICIEGMEAREKLGENINTIRNLVVNPAHDRVLATTKQSQIYCATLISSVNPGAAAETVVDMEYLGESLHHGPIVGLTMCAWKPIFMTCGEIDRSVRVWDFTTESQILTKYYEEDIFSVALHPTGLCAVIGLVEKLQYVLVLLDNLKTIQEFSIRTCREAAFSHSGHMFAAVDASTIQVFSCITFQCVYYLKGHNDVIRSLVWTSNDKSLYSCGSDGAVYEWNMFDGTRASNVITKHCDYKCVASTQDGKMVYGVGSDGLLKEICNAEVLREESFNHSCLTAIQLSRSDLMMFIAGTKGAVLSVRYPMPRPPEYSEFFLHNYPITKMGLTYDDLNLVTCSDDGTMCIWKLVNTEGNCVKMDPGFSYLKEILINKDDLVAEDMDLLNDLETMGISLENNNSYQEMETEQSYDKVKEFHAVIQDLENTNQINKDDLAEKINMIKYLENSLKYLETDHAHQVKDMEKKHSHKIKELHIGYCTAIEDFKDKHQIIEDDLTKKIDMIKHLENSLKSLETDHAHQVKEMEMKQSHKVKGLHIGYCATIQDLIDKNQELVVKHTIEIKNMENNALEMKRKHLAAIEKLESCYNPIVEYNNYQENIKMSRDNELSRQLDEISKSQEKVLAEMTQECGKMLISKQIVIQEMDKEINNQQQTIKNQEIQIADLTRENGLLKERECVREKRWNKRSAVVRRPRTTDPHRSIASLVKECLELKISVSRQNQSRRSELSKPVTKKLEHICICQRPKTVLTCCKCNFRLVGRVRQTCPIHPRTSFLMDLSQCPKCFAFDEMVEEKT